MTALGWLATDISPAGSPKAVIDKRSHLKLIEIDQGEIRSMRGSDLRVEFYCTW